MEGIVTTLALLACPVGMGLMMLFMGRGLFGQRSSNADRSLAEMRAEQRRLAAEIEELEPQNGRNGTRPHEAASVTAPGDGSPTS